jgi:hypothetical protein
MSTDAESAEDSSSEPDEGPSAPPVGEQLWGQMEFPFGYPAAIDRIGTTAAPLLAGFAFTLIALTLDKQGDIWKPDLALLLLVAASVGLVWSVQFNFNARRFYVSLEEYFDLVKLETEDGIKPGTAKELVRGDLGKHKTWAGLSRVSYNLGVAVLFLGVAATLVPATGIDHMAPLRAAAVLALTAAGAVEALLSLLEAITGAWGRLMDRK